MPAATATHTSSGTSGKHYRLIGGQYPAFQNPDGTWDITGVRTFSEIPRGANHNTIPVDARWHDGAIALHRTLEREGYLPPLHIYHHSDSPFGAKPERAGFYRLRGRVEASVRGKPQSVLVADFVKVPAAVFSRIERGELPYVSVETPKGYTEAEVLSAALLDSEPPFCPLPLLTVGSKTRALHGRRRAAASTHRLMRWMHAAAGAGVSAAALMRPGLRKGSAMEDSRDRDDRDEHGYPSAVVRNVDSDRSPKDRANTVSETGRSLAPAGRDAKADLQAKRASIVAKGPSRLEPRGGDGYGSREDHGAPMAPKDDDAEEHGATPAPNPSDPLYTTPKPKRDPFAGAPAPIKGGARDSKGNPMLDPFRHERDEEYDMEEHATHALGDIEAPEDRTELETHAIDDDIVTKSRNAQAPRHGLASPSATPSRPSGFRPGEKPRNASGKPKSEAHMEDQTEIISHADDAAAPAGMPAAPPAPAGPEGIDMAALSKLVARELFALMHGEGEAQVDELDAGPTPVEPDDMTGSAGVGEGAVEDEYPDEAKMTHDRREQHARRRAQENRRVAQLEAEVAALKAANEERSRAQAHSRMIREAEERLAGLHLSEDTRKRLRSIAKHGKAALDVFVETLEETLPQDPPETFDSFSTPRRTPAAEPELEKYAAAGADELAFARQHFPRFRELHQRRAISSSITFDEFLEAQKPGSPIWSAEDQDELDKTIKQPRR